MKKLVVSHQRSVDTTLNCQDYGTRCEWVQFYFLCAVSCARDDLLEIVYTIDELCVI